LRRVERWFRVVRNGAGRVRKKVGKLSSDFVWGGGCYSRGKKGKWPWLGEGEKSFKHIHEKKREEKRGVSREEKKKDRRRKGKRKTHGDDGLREEKNSGRKEQRREMGR